MRPLSLTLRKVRRAAELTPEPHAGEKHVRDKAVASLSRFLSAGRIQARTADGEDEDESKQDEELPVGELKWEDEWTVDARLRPDEMAKLWKGIFYCAFAFPCALLLLQDS